MRFINYLSPENKIRVLQKLERKAKKKRIKESLARRIDLFKLNGVTVHRITTAYIYIIKNKSFNNWYKIGTCIDLNKRLSSYQTADPLTGYEIANSWISDNRWLVEDAFLGYATRSSLFDVKGEWIYCTDYKLLKNKLVRFISMKEGKLIEEIKCKKKFEVNRQLTRE